LESSFIYFKAGRALNCDSDNSSMINVHDL
jgi:hypothetical protein